VVEGLGQKYRQIASAAIPAASAVERMGLDRLPLVVSSPSTAAARAYADLWAETVGRLGLR
jgi:chromosome partitioning protein